MLKTNPFLQGFLFVYLCFNEKKDKVILEFKLLAPKI